MNKWWGRGPVILSGNEHITRDISFFMSTVLADCRSLGCSRRDGKGQRACNCPQIAGISGSPQATLVAATFSADLNSLGSEDRLTDDAGDILN
jgi:hypothetical protein